MKITNCLYLAMAFLFFAILPVAWAEDKQDSTYTVVQEGGAAETGGMQGFQLPADENTYVVTYNLRGLACVQDVGTVNQCAVPNQSADEGGYPWTKVKCKGRDTSVSTFAWSLDTNQPMSIYEAPPSLITSAKTYTVNVRLGRVCMKSGK